MDYKFMWQELRGYLRRHEKKYKTRAKEDLSESDIKNYTFHSGKGCGMTDALIEMQSIEKEAKEGDQCTR